MLLSSSGYIANHTQSDSALLAIKACYLYIPALLILASMLWMAAERDQALPRPPVPSQPADSDPFSHEDIDDEDAGTD